MFILTTTGTESFGIVGIQIDDTLFLGNNKFAKLESEDLAKANLKAIPVEKLSDANPLIFNGGKLIKDNRDIIFIQKRQAKLIELIDHKSPTKNRDYLVQRARAHISLQYVSRKQLMIYRSPLNTKISKMKKFFH